MVSVIRMAVLELTYPGDLDEYDREVEGIEIRRDLCSTLRLCGLPNGYELLVPNRYT